MRETPWLKRGDIFYIEPYQTVGSEQYAGRPAIVVSNDENNFHSPTIEVVYLTTKPKMLLPTHVHIMSCSKDSTALCEQITTISVERVGDCKGHITDDEMAEIEAAMSISLGFQKQTQNVSASEVTEPAYNGYNRDDLIDELTEKLRQSETKCEMLQQMYDALLNKVVKVG